MPLIPRLVPRGCFRRWFPLLKWWTLMGLGTPRSPIPVSDDAGSNGIPANRDTARCHRVGSGDRGKQHDRCDQRQEPDHRESDAPKVEQVVDLAPVGELLAPLSDLSEKGVARRVVARLDDRKEHPCPQSDGTTGADYHPSRRASFHVGQR
jgi:hypothetical protein